MKNPLWLSLIFSFLLYACSPPVSDESYSIVDSDDPEATYGWYDISAGTEFVPGDEAFSAQVQIGFPFQLFDVSYAGAYINTKGFISLQSFVEKGNYLPQQIPDSHGVNSIIAALWADLNPSLGGNIYHQTMGIAPNRIFVVTYDNIPYSDLSGSVTFQIALYETSNIIDFQYQDFATDNRRHTLGIENADGTRGCFIEGRNLEDFTLADEYTIRFSPAE